jgi:uncharacterized membrane protein
VCLLSSFAAWLAGSTFWWAVGGVLLGSVIPFTLIVILPTNKQLLSPTLDKRSVQAAQLLARWGTLHHVRSVLGGTAFVAVPRPLNFRESDVTCHGVKPILLFGA